MTAQVRHLSDDVAPWQRAIKTRRYVNNALDTKRASWRVHPRCARILSFATEGESPWRKCRDPSWCAYLRRDTSVPCRTEKQRGGEGSRANRGGSVSQTFSAIIQRAIIKRDIKCRALTRRDKLSFSLCNFNGALYQCNERVDRSSGVYFYLAILAWRPRFDRAFFRFLNSSPRRK